jgi:Tfp pilus assembly protein PilN
LALHRPVSIAEGLCLRRAADGAAVAAMNLMPPDLMAAKQRAARRRLVRLAGIGLALVYAVCVAAAVGGFAWRMTELGSLQGQAAELTKNRDRVRALQTELKLLQDRVSDHSVPLECLVEIVGIKPEGVFLTEFNFQDGEQLTLSGYAPTATAVTDEFNPKLEKSKWFPGGTKMAPLVTQKIKGNEVVRFSIQCFLQKQAGASRRAGSHRR